MKQKHIYILGVIFFALIAVNAFQKIHASKKSGGEVRHEEWHPFIPADKVARIHFSRPGHAALALAKDGAQWKVESLFGANAENQKISELLKQLNQMKAELRAEGESLYERFGITDKEAFRIQILDSTGAALVDFLMGDHRAGKGIFIRLAGKQKIYFTADDVPALFGLSENLEGVGPQPLVFADLKLVPEGFEQIQRFDVTEIKNGKEVSLAALERPSTDAGTAWKFVSKTWPYAAGHEKIEDYLGIVLAAHAGNISGDIPQFKKEIEIMLRDARGKVLRLQFARADGVRRGSVSELTPPRRTPSGWLVKREGTVPLFKISTPVFDDLKTDDARFVAENPLHFNLDEENTVELIHDGKTEKFSKASGWPSAAAILDAASRLQFTGLELDATARNLAVIPPTHRLRVTRTGIPAIEIGFYLTDPNLTEIKAVISGQDFVFKVSRAFFDDIFVPEKAPPKEENAAAMKYSVV